MSFLWTEKSKKTIVDDYIKTVSTSYDRKAVAWYGTMIVVPSTQDKDYTKNPPNEFETVYDFMSGDGIFVSPANREVFARDLPRREDVLASNMPEGLRTMFNVIGGYKDTKTSDWISSKSTSDLYTFQADTVRGLLKQSNEKTGPYNEWIAQIKEGGVGVFNYETGKFGSEESLDPTAKKKGQTLVLEKFTLSLLLRVMITAFTKYMNATDSSGTRVNILPLEKFVSQSHIMCQARLHQPELILPGILEKSIDVLTTCFGYAISRGDQSSFLPSTLRCMKAYITHAKACQDNSKTRLRPCQITSISYTEIESHASDTEVFLVGRLFGFTPQSSAEAVSLLPSAELNAKIDNEIVTLTFSNVQHTLSLKKGAIPFHYETMSALAEYLIPPDMLKTPDFLAVFFLVIEAFVLNIPPQDIVSLFKIFKHYSE